MSSLTLFSSPCRLDTTSSCLHHSAAYSDPDIEHTLTQFIADALNRIKTGGSSESPDVLGKSDIWSDLMVTDFIRAVDLDDDSFED